MEKSESITELAGALAIAQAQFLPVKRTEHVGYQTKSGEKKYSYAPLENIIDACRKALSDNGLAILQPTVMVEGNIVVETILIHSSGQWISGQIRIEAVNKDPQSEGSALTYARRYALSAMLGIVSEEDDDAESAMGRDTKKETPPTKKAETDKALLTDAQRKKIIMAAKEKGLLVKKDGKDEFTQEFKAHVAVYGRAHITELLKSEASQLIEDIEGDKIKKADNSLVQEAIDMGAEVVSQQMNLKS